MESLGLRLRSNGGDPSPALPIHRDGRFDARSWSNRTVKMPERLKRIPVQAFSVSANVASDRNRKEESSSSLLGSYVDAMIRSCSSNHHRDRVQGSVSSEVLHFWVTNAIREIVRHLREAPFLVHVYSNPNSNSNMLTFRRETGVAERWPHIKRSWDEGTPVPDGIILVEQLKSFTYDKDFEERAQSRTRLWGILVQGRGAESHACYLLKTCGVFSCGGSCTHWVLVRTQSFEDAADLQLMNSWVL